MAIRVTAGTPSTPAGRARAEESRGLLEGELARVRAQAENWRNGLAALLGLLTAVGIVKGPDTLQGLSGGARGTVGVLLLGGLLLSAGGAFFAMRAAFGLPRRRVADASLEELLTRERLTVRRAVRDLRRAVVAGFLALAMVTAGIGLTWYGPRPGNPGVLIVQTDGSVLCGTLTGLDAKGARLRVKDVERRVPSGRIGSAKSVESCP
ncbi:MULTISPECIES: hypothetical protein [unclassified Streptomyces]|uniref:hypothetical protein n=1 Tax=unclassified Streptomyces TaxID=2593676 RepID=UPI0006FEA532|nr:MULTISPECIES: hypothetical protein [unclassified Streptomyces]KQX55790.1 hypothetical protein ASD33_30925 [Streptomyces sp. Root1304]KRA96387.1 hypothetical protein ASE09_27690 [Streptomyces sp. Root66D1]